MRRRTAAQKTNSEDDHKTSSKDDELLDAAFEAVCSVEPALDKLLKSVYEDTHWHDGMKRRLMGRFDHGSDVVFVTDWVNAILQKYNEKKIRELAVFRSQAEAGKAYKLKYREVKSSLEKLEKALATFQREACRLSEENKTQSRERIELTIKQKKKRLEIRKLENRLLQLSSENKKLQGQVRCIDPLNKEIKTVNARISELIVEKKRIADKCKLLKLKLEKKESQGEIAKAGEKIKRLLCKIKEQDTTVSSLKKNDHYLSEGLEASQDESRIVQIEMEERIRRLQTECAKYKGALGGQSPKSIIVVDILGDNATKKASKKRDAAKTSSRQGRSRKMDIQKLSRQFENKLDFFRKNNTQLRREKAELEKEIEDLQLSQ